MEQMLTSFAISVAANIVTSLFARNDTEKEIRKAFQEAIEMWSPNEDIRRYKEDEIYLFVQRYIAHPALDAAELSDEQRAFLKCFEKCVAQHAAAASYLSAIKEKEYYEVVMSSLQLVHSKLDAINQKLEEHNLRHEELHFEAVAQINTILHEVVEEPINALLYGITAIFDREIYAYTDVKNNGDVEVVIDSASRLVEDEDGDSYRPKFHDVDYDWEQERYTDWHGLNPDWDFCELFEDSMIAKFQLVNIDFYDGIDELQQYIDRKSINDQLSIDEKRLLTEIVASMRAVQAIVDDHPDMFLKVENLRFKNLQMELLGTFNDHGEKIGHFLVRYDDGVYSEGVTETYAPMVKRDELLDVYMLAPEYYYKMTGYLGHLFSLLPEWWEISGKA